MNLREYTTFSDIFYFVPQNNLQFRLDANFDNITTYFSPFSVLKSIFVKIWHNSCNEYMSWSWVYTQVSLVDVVWRVSLRNVKEIFLGIPRNFYFFGGKFTFSCGSLERCEVWTSNLVQIIFRKFPIPNLKILSKSVDLVTLWILEKWILFLGVLRKELYSLK